MLKVRKLEKDDYNKGYFELLSHLTVAPDVGFEKFSQVFDSLDENYSIHVVELDGKVVATGTLLLEQKFIRGARKVGHIEDIVSHKDHQGKGLGKAVVSSLIEEAEKRDCYKVILDCSDDNVSFYEKLGFVVKERQMVRYY